MTFDDVIKLVNNIGIAGFLVIFYAVKMNKTFESLCDKLDELIRLVRDNKK